MSDEEHDEAPDPKPTPASGFGERDGNEATRRVATLPHLIAKSRRPDRPVPDDGESSLEEETFNPSDDLFDHELDDDFFDDLFSDE